MKKRAKLILTLGLILLLLPLSVSATYTYVNPYNMADIKIAFVVSPGICSGSSWYNKDSVEYEIWHHLSEDNAVVTCISPEVTASELVGNYNITLEINPLLGKSTIQEIINAGGNLILLFNATKDLNNTDGVIIGVQNTSKLRIADNSTVARGYPPDAFLESCNFYEINNTGEFTSIVISNSSEKSVVATKSYGTGANVALIGIQITSDESFNAYRILEKAVFWETDSWDRLTDAVYNPPGNRYDVPGVAMVVYDPRSLDRFTNIEKYIYNWLQPMIGTELMPVELSEITLMDMAQTELIIVVGPRRVTSLLSGWMSQNKDIMFLYEGTSDLTSLFGGEVYPSSITEYKNSCDEADALNDRIASNLHGEITYGYPLNAHINTQGSGTRYLMNLPTMKTLIADSASNDSLLAYYTTSGSTSSGSSTSDIIAYGINPTLKTYHGDKFFQRMYDWIRGTLNITAKPKAKTFVIPTYGGNEGPTAQENSLYNLLDSLCPGGVSKIELSEINLTDYSSTRLVVIHDYGTVSSMIPYWNSSSIRMMYVYDGVAEAVDLYGGSYSSDAGGWMDIASADKGEITYGYVSGGFIPTQSNCRYTVNVDGFKPLVNTAFVAGSSYGGNLINSRGIPLLLYRNSPSRSLIYGFSPSGAAYHDKKLFNRGIAWLLDSTPEECINGTLNDYLINTTAQPSRVALVVLNKNSLSGSPPESNNEEYIKDMLENLDNEENISYSLLEVSEIIGANYSDCEAIVFPHTIEIGDYYYDCLSTNISIILLREGFINFINNHGGGGPLLPAEGWQGTGIIDTENSNHSLLTFGYPKEAKITVCSNCGSGSSIGLTWASLPENFNGLVEANPEELPGGVHDRYIVVSNEQDYSSKIVLMGFEPNQHHGEVLFDRSVLWVLNQSETVDKTKDIVLIVYNENSLSSEEELVKEWLIEKFGVDRVSTLEVSNAMVADLWGSSRYVCLDNNLVSGVLNYWHSLGYGIVLIGDALNDAADALGVSSIGGVDLLSDEYSGIPYGIIKTLHGITNNLAVNTTIGLADSYEGVYAVTDLNTSLFTTVVSHSNSTGPYEEVLLATYETFSEGIWRRLALFGINPLTVGNKAKNWLLNAVNWVAATDIEEPKINSITITPEEFSNTQAINFTVNITDNKCIGGRCLGVYSAWVNYTVNVSLGYWNISSLSRSESNVDIWLGSIGPLYNSSYILYQIIATDTTGNKNESEFYYYGIPTDTTPPVISQVAMSSSVLELTEDLTINWRTDEISDSWIYYRLNDTEEWTILTDTGFTTIHSINTGNHSAGDYQFYIKSCDIARNCRIDDNNGEYYEFCSGPQCEDVPPKILSHSPVNGTVFESLTTSFTLIITTDESAECRYSTISGIEFDAMSNLFDSSDNITHTALITDLLPGESYSYHIRCKDIPAGNVNAEYSLYYSVAALDKTPPVITLISPDNNSTIIGENVTFSYIVNDNSSISRCSLYTDTTGEWSLNQDDTEVTKGVIETFTLKLSDGIYAWNVKCWDSMNNSAFSDLNYTFRVNTWVPSLIFGGYSGCNNYDAPEGKFCNLHGIAVDSDGYIYVLDTENYRVQVFDSDGEYQERFGGCDTKGEELGKFEDPEGIAIREINENLTKIYITDTRNHRIEVRTIKITNETSNVSWQEFGERGDYKSSGKEIYLEEPRGIAVDSDGEMYIANSGNDRIEIIDPDFTLNSEITGSNLTDRLNQPCGVAVDGDKRVYVADTLNHRIRIFYPNGSQILSFGEYGSEDSKFNSPEAIALDGNGNIYIADTGNSRIQIFDSNGEYRWEFGNENCSSKIASDPLKAVGQFCHPSGIAIDDERVYVSDTENNRVQVFDIRALPTTTTTTIPPEECPTEGDYPPCDGTVTDFELLRYINAWIDGLVSDFSLLMAIDHWAVG